ncbi:hypothetical protein ABI_44810 [Asticcacaulis biprosthecium C19]|uniref:Uncharacterized protein n=1 Tax=Asticcacaulis biprosthecium C19 TaxID=715226 RepID=F4QTI4_9CAUL|nr:hypothetical protein ABI_44810 [Asticcacaulis biprosthecium C19]
MWRTLLRTHSHGLLMAFEYMLRCGNFNSLPSVPNGVEAISRKFSATV